MTSDADLNELVAKRLGWFNLTKYAPMGWDGTKEKRRLVGSFHTVGADANLIDVPDYCGSIEAAWAIVEKLHPTNCFTLFSWPARFIVRIVGNTEKDVFQAEADTAPRAIALAFLKLENGGRE